jgi:hypothetical protein
METLVRFLLRAVLVLGLGFSLGHAGEQAQGGGKDANPQFDDPPLGKGRFFLYEDFEGTGTGQIPHGFQKTGGVSVVEDVAHSGRKSLRIEAAPTGARRITVKGDVLKQLGGQHWGRLYFKVQLPTPEPANGVIHSTLVAGSAKSPLAKDAIEVRVLDTVLGNKGTYQFIYNVQPSGRAEFGKGSGYDSKFTDEWTLAEWYVDYATQSYRLFINGKEMTGASFSKGAGQFADAEIGAPAMESPSRASGRGQVRKAEPRAPYWGPVRVPE